MSYDLVSTATEPVPGAGSISATGPVSGAEPYAAPNPWPPAAKPRNQTYKTVAIILFVVVSAVTEFPF